MCIWEAIEFDLGGPDAGVYSAWHEQRRALDEMAPQLGAGSVADETVFHIAPIYTN